MDALNRSRRLLPMRGSTPPLPPADPAPPPGADPAASASAAASCRLFQISAGRVPICEARSLRSRDSNATLAEQRALHRRWRHERGLALGALLFEALVLLGALALTLGWLLVGEGPIETVLALGAVAANASVIALSARLLVLSSERETFAAHLPNAREVAQLAACVGSVPALGIGAFVGLVGFGFQSLEGGAQSASFAHLIVTGLAMAFGLGLALAAAVLLAGLIVSRLRRLRHLSAPPGSRSSSLP
ncbi:MAG: hypothetical protein OEY14_14835 [Myxococcales bacterium]|nr:hypothetical protein [Myxococcales bacterium]